MLTLFHQPLCPRSRYVRLIFGEYGIPARLVEERFWERREEFLLLNPAGELPVLVTEGQPPIPGRLVTRRRMVGRCPRRAFWTRPPIPGPLLNGAKV